MSANYNIRFIRINHERFVTSARKVFRSISLHRLELFTLTLGRGHCAARRDPPTLTLMIRGPISLLHLVVALSTPLIAESPGFDWNDLHRRVAELLQRGSVADAQSLLEESVQGARLRHEASAG